MEDTALYTALQGAVERSRGAATWTDALLAVKRAKEAKVKAALDAIMGDWSLEDLMKAEAVAEKEVFRKQPAAAQVAKPAAPAPVAAGSAAKRK